MDGRILRVFRLNSPEEGIRISALKTSAVAGAPGVKFVAKANSQYESQLISSNLALRSVTVPGPESFKARRRAWKTWGLSRETDL